MNTRQTKNHNQGPPIDESKHVEATKTGSLQNAEENHIRIFWPLPLILQLPSLPKLTLSWKMPSFVICRIIDFVSAK
jgi:hypothetical protein